MHGSNSAQLQHFYFENTEICFLVKVSVVVAMSSGRRDKSVKFQLFKGVCG